MARDKPSSTPPKHGEKTQQRLVLKNKGSPWICNTCALEVISDTAYLLLDRGATIESVISALGRTATAMHIGVMDAERRLRQ